MNKPWITAIGFVLFMLGCVSILISLVGLQISFLKWADDISRVFGFVFKTIIMLTGIIVAYLSKLDNAKETDEYLQQGRR